MNIAKNKSVTVVIGAQFGDEGKGRIVDALAQEADFVVRFNGGNNAGHTIINEYGEFALHLVPAGIFYPHTLNIIGNGVVVDLASLVAEMGELEKRGIVLKGRLKISTRAHLVMPWHLLLDAAQEEQRGGQKIGTTLRGIGPAFADKVARTGIRVEDLLNKKQFLAKLAQLYPPSQKAERLGKSELAVRETIAAKYFEYREVIAPYVVRTEPLLWKALGQGKRILLEGAQGVALDLDFGTYPYVTSSPAGTGVAAAAQGSGIPATKFDRIIGVAKAYVTRVGAGPLPTEMPNEIAARIRKAGREYGATTGRPRRCGWLDLAQLKEAIATQGISELALTKLDVLGILPEILVRDGTGSSRKLSYVRFSGWGRSLDNCATYGALPARARRYLEFLAARLGVPITLISTGPQRQQLLTRLS